MGVIWAYGVMWVYLLLSFKAVIMKILINDLLSVEMNAFRSCLRGSEELFDSF